MECPAPPPGGGSPAEFSARQLDQLRSAVQAAMREEMIRAHRPHDGALFQECRASSNGRSGGGPSAASALAASGRGGNPWGKVADEPVVAEEELGSPTLDKGSAVACPSAYEKGRSNTIETILKQGTSFTVDEDAPWWKWAHYHIHTVVHGAYFEMVMGMMIIVNCIFIGIEVQLRLNGEDMVVISWLDSVFLIWFVIEALLRIVADGTSAFQNGWFRFDVALVSGGVAISWVIMPIIEASGVANETPYASQLLTLRVLRLLRTVRAFRSMTAFSELCRLCTGLLRSVKTMFAVVLLVALSIFSFAVLGVDLITNSEKLNSNDETRVIVESNFSSLSAFMLTLAQFTTADSLAGIYYPLCRADPVLGLYFVALWIVITVALMNLVTAVIVDSALSLGREEADERLAVNRRILAKNIPTLEALFDEIDKDGSGSVTLLEIQHMYKAGELTFPKDVTDMIDPDHLVSMFDFLDKDKSGEVDAEEFVDGVCSLALSSMSIEAMQMLQLLRSCHQMLVDYQAPASPTSPSKRSTTRSPPVDY